MTLNAFTVDVESWCHASTERFEALPGGEQRGSVLRGLDILLNLLDRRRIRATFFVVGQIAESMPDLVPRLAAAGHEIGSHGYLHRRIDQMVPEEFDADLARSQDILARQTNSPVLLYRAPVWSLYPARRWAIPLLIRRGFRFDSSLFPLRIVGSPRLPRAPYNIQTEFGMLTEIPPLTTQGLFTRYPLGGTWGLRVFFYNDVHRAVRRSNTSGHPALFHLHPWEFDPQRPSLRQPFWTRIALTLRFSNLEKRLDRLLSEFSFGPLTGSINGTPRPTLRVEDLP